MALDLDTSLKLGLVLYVSEEVTNASKMRIYISNIAETTTSVESKRILRLLLLVADGSLRCKAIALFNESLKYLPTNKAA